MDIPVKRPQSRSYKYLAWFQKAKELNNKGWKNWNIEDRNWAWHNPMFMIHHLHTQTSIRFKPLIIEMIDACDLLYYNRQDYDFHRFFQK